MNIKPFKALRPRNEIAEKLVSPPYDVLNSKEARNYASDNEYSFLHITKSEIDLPQKIDIHSLEVYEKAAQNLQKFIENKYLIQDEIACYYIYELEMNGKQQTGLVCGSSIEDYKSDLIKKHEYTRAEKEKDRIDHMQTIKAQTGNVFLAYNDVEEMNIIVKKVKQDNPLYNFITSDNVKHKIWIVNNSNQINIITDIFKSKVPFTYIADGHHRAASAAKVSNVFPNNLEAQFFLTTIFPASELNIMDYNRVVKDLNGLNEESFLNKLKEDFEITISTEKIKPNCLHQFGMYLNKKWYLLTAKENTFTTDPIGILDVTILQNNVLKKILDIKDVRTDSRIDFVGGIRGINELEKRVDSGEMSLAFSLFPVTIQQLFNIADNNMVMPPKSTWFEPKLRDGFFTHLI